MIWRGMGGILRCGTVVTQKGHGNMGVWGHGREEGDDDIVRGT